MFTLCFARYCSRFAVPAKPEASARAGKARPHVAQRRGYNGFTVNKHCKRPDFLLNLRVKCRP
jgi:hypothetical protein